MEKGVEKRGALSHELEGFPAMEHGRFKWMVLRFFPKKVTFVTKKKTEAMWKTTPQNGARSLIHTYKLF